jgi:Na+-translocating ferredoxin:NAD+ oxidoreductase RnfG subunit
MITLRAWAIPWVTLAFAAVCVCARPASAQEVLLTRDAALREIFPGAARTSIERREISAEMKSELERSLGRRILDREIEVISVFDSSQALVGRAVVTSEIGKYRPITFMVGVTPELAVRGVEVMVYRESRGGDVKRQRFLSQYRGKRADDPIDSNRDIINISGATLSVRAMNAGVKRVLEELTILYGKP